MGYPMNYRRVVERNYLHGDYDPESSTGLIAGDLRRLESDQRDSFHLDLYAKHAGITPEQAKKVLDLFFGD